MSALGFIESEMDGPFKGHIKAIDMTSSTGERSQVTYDDKGRALYIGSGTVEEFVFEETRWYKDNPDYTEVWCNGKLESLEKYNEQGKSVWIKDLEREFEEWREYTSDGGLISIKNADGYKAYTVRDFRGSVIYSKGGFRECWSDYEYDDKNNITHRKDFSRKLDDSSKEKSFDKEVWFERDDKGNIIHEKERTSDGSVSDCRITYDDKGNAVEKLYSSGFKKLFKYDDVGNITYYKDSKGHEEWAEYEYYPEKEVVRKEEKEALADKISSVLGTMDGNKNKAVVKAKSHSCGMEL